MIGTPGAQPLSAAVTIMSGVLAAASATATVVWCRSMSAMDMPMPGGWTMSMAWMRTPGQTWSGAAASFLAMWVVMMLAMMLPATVPALRRYAETVGRTTRADALGFVAIVAAGYLAVWATVGLAVFPIGATAAAMAMARPEVARAVPMAIGIVLLLAGAWQLTSAKAAALACCGAEAARGGDEPPSARSAWGHGLRLGVRCLRCCGNLMAVLLVLGVMDLAAMAAVTAAIAAERLTPAGPHLAKAAGIVVIGAAALVCTRALQS